MIIKAQAKLNLAIDLIGKRNDGYHDIDMISIPLELHDCLEIDEISFGNDLPTRISSSLTSSVL